MINRHSSVTLSDGARATSHRAVRLCLAQALGREIRFPDIELCIDPSRLHIGMPYGCRRPAVTRTAYLVAIEPDQMGRALPLRGRVNALWRATESAEDRA